jgi:hypothetical protein
VAQTKGAVLKAWIGFLNERYGAQAIGAAMASLAPADKQLVSSPFLDSSWYAYDTLHALRRLNRLLVTAADGDLSEDIGRHIAQEVFTGVYRSLLARDPIKQIEKFAWISDFFFRETRTLDTEVMSPRTCLVRYRYDQGARPTRGICSSLLGFWSRTLELSGASNVRAAHRKCVVEGAECCEFTFAWE